MTREELIDAYCAAWAEPGEAVRTAQLATLLTEGCRYTDPRTDVTGPRALSEHIGTILAARPGSRVERATAVQEHHDLARFGFRVVGADGSVLLQGADVVEFDGAGLITRIVGFFD